MVGHPLILNELLSRTLLRSAEVPPAAGGLRILGGSLQASKARPFLLKGSICSSLALWQRPPTKANQGAGLACTRSPKDLCSFLEERRLLCLDRLREERRRAVEHDSTSA